ncbi:MAG: YcxB family protein [Sphingobacteriia bacterium]|nr:MAG: YcxB family protein [Sphingobacteriia bacterium]
MRHAFAYEKKKVVQALRYHFVQLKEIRILLIAVNVFAIGSAALFYFKMIRPEPFLLGSLLWLSLMLAFWYLIPNSLYRKSATFKDQFVLANHDKGLSLENPRGETFWEWTRFQRYFESPHFIHLYFDTRSFFLVPKEGINDADMSEWRTLLREKIGG